MKILLDPRPESPGHPTAVAITAGIAASSIALIAFGLDSVIEFFAAAVVVWQLRDGSSERETRAVHFIGITFFVLAAYLTVEGIHDLITHAKPEVSVPGLVVAAAALLVMPLLAWAKQRTGQALCNRTLIADVAESYLCALTFGCRSAWCRPERLAWLVVG